jgi:hypothetical protein
MSMSVSLIQFDPAATYVAAKKILLEGVTLNPGDPVPSSFKILRSPHKIELLVRNRRLRPVYGMERTREAMPVPPVPVSSQEQPEEVRPVLNIDLAEAPHGTLIEICKQLKLSAAGSSDALRKRIRAVVD